MPEKPSFKTPDAAKDYLAGLYCDYFPKPGTQFPFDREEYYVEIRLSLEEPAEQVEVVGQLLNTMQLRIDVLEMLIPMRDSSLQRFNDNPPRWMSLHEFKRRDGEELYELRQRYVRASENAHDTVFKLQAAGRALGIEIEQSGPEPPDEPYPG